MNKGHQEQDDFVAVGHDPAIQRGRAPRYGHVKAADDGMVYGRTPRFRDILSAGTRPLKRAGLRFVTDEPMRADLKRKPRGHRRNCPSQNWGS